MHLGSAVQIGHFRKPGPVVLSVIQTKTEGINAAKLGQPDRFVHPR
jgi:hypothetical protein